MVVHFECGHHTPLSPSMTEAPVCGCGERRIARVDAPAPSFRGTCTGPSATTVDLPPLVVNLCLNDAQPLPLRKLGKDA